MNEETQWYSFGNHLSSSSRKYGQKLGYMHTSLTVLVHRSVYIAVYVVVLYRCIQYIAVE